MDIMKQLKIKIGEQTAIQVEDNICRMIMLTYLILLGHGSGK
jgi:hypothetical protein